MIATKSGGMLPEDSDADTQYYRLCKGSEIPEDAWKTRLSYTTAYNGVKGLDDQFMHLSTAAQVVKTAELYFAGATDLVLLVFGHSLIDEYGEITIKWEDAAPSAGSTKRDGEFPHAYGGAIPYACLVGLPIPLQLDADGKHVFPKLPL